ncbi:MAG: hypothetical protein RL346_1509 [Verrucomicrobiota bacterium]|jgi:hypothetical protein
MKMTIGLPKSLLLGCSVLTMMICSSCVPLVAGAAVGYVAHAEGYRAENPLKKNN